MKKNIWLVGTGSMARDYTKVLAALKCEVVAIGRSVESVEKFKAETRIPAMCGGLGEYLKTNPIVPDAAIVAVGVEDLSAVARELIEYGVKQILLEKPGALEMEDLLALQEVAILLGAEVFIAYNRRFYTSVQEAKKRIDLDGGALSFNFEFTEWNHVIEGLKKDRRVKEAWFMANSTHVADMAFFLGGAPETIHCLHRGSLDWHKASARFAGAGVSSGDVLFSYTANWDAPGRWSVEILTKSYRFIFKPLEALQVVHKGQVVVEDVPIDDELDRSFKPGLYCQVREFLNGKTEQLCGLDYQLKMFAIYNQMAGYA